MNKITLGTSVVAIIISLSSLWYTASSSELVYVDVNKLLSGYERTAVVKKEFEVKSATMKANLDSLQAGWQNELKNFEKVRSSMTAKELELKKELLSNKQQQINNYQRSVQRKLQEEDQKVTQTVINDINSFVKEYGEEHNYKVIFGATGGGNVMYAHETTDLTEEVLTALNKDFTGER